MNIVRLPLVATVVGYAGTLAYNAHRGAKVLNPSHSAMVAGCGAIFYMVIRRASNYAIPTTPTEESKGSSRAYAKKLLSASLAVCLTAQAMKYEGLSPNTARYLKTLGLVSALVFLALGSYRTVAPKPKKSSRNTNKINTNIKRRYPSTSTNPSSSNSSASSSGSSQTNFVVPQPSSDVQLWPTLNRKPFILRGNVVNTDIVVTGSGGLQATNSTFEKLIQSGAPLQFNKCTMKGDVVSQSTLTAEENTTFEKGLYILNGTALLYDCRLKNLYIDDQGNSPEIKLYGNTVVEGDIIFKTGMGRVSKHPTVVIKGNILGGTVTDIDIE